MDSYEEATIHIEKIQRSLSALMRMPSVFIKEEKQLLMEMNDTIARIKRAIGVKTNEIF